MKGKGFVVTVEEDFPSDLQFMTDGIGPNENPIWSQTSYLRKARIFNEDAAQIVADRVRNWYEENMSDREVEVETREVEFHLKEK